MSGKGKRAMRHDLLKSRTKVAACYPRREYWRVEMTVTGWRDNSPVQDTVTLAPDVRVRASQMHTMVVEQWRSAAADLDEISESWFDLYRVSPERHRQMVDDEIVRVLASEVAA